MNSQENQSSIFEEEKYNSIYSLKSANYNHMSQYVTVQHSVDHREKTVSRNFSSINKIPSNEVYQNLQAQRKSVSLNRRMLAPSQGSQGSQNKGSKYQVAGNQQFKKRKVPNISAKCWAIYDVNKMSIVYGRREYQKREVASLTKIMTSWVVINLCKDWNLDVKTTEVIVSDIASDIRGTCANLKAGDILTVDQLLYGLMLPSGNDAAFALAQYFGKRLYNKKYTKKDSKKIQSFQFDYHPYYAKYFLQEMNDFAQKLDMQLTHFDSPHGLQNIENLSTAYDLAKLSAICIKNEYFREIVSTPYYECVAKQRVIPTKPQPKQRKKSKSKNSNSNSKKKEKEKQQEEEEFPLDDYANFEKHIKEDKIGHYVERHYKWENTNFMLRQPNYNGLKTGITEAAGACLSASYQNMKDSKQWFIIILLNSKSMIARWEEVPQLVEWAKNHIEGMNRLPFILNNSVQAPNNFNQKKENNFQSKTTMTSTRSNSKQMSTRNSFTRANSTVNKSVVYTGPVGQPSGIPRAPITINNCLINNLGQAQNIR